MSQKGHLMAAFEDALLKLNDEQKEAVLNTEGPVMVIAGPGTGKTQILSLRIANIILKTHTKPENILALTFTDAGAHAMRLRLAQYLGEAAYKVAVHTFHSFAGLLINNYPDSYTRIVGGRPASELEKLSIVEDIINSGNFKWLRPHGDPLYYVNQIPKAISDLKKEYVTPDILAERITKEENSLSTEQKYHDKGSHKGKVRHAYLELEKKIGKHLELLAVYRMYEAVMRERRLFDFEDMIIETVVALESDKEMRRDLQETYQYILADEHQDVNESQNKILELLAEYHERPNIFVVGDEKQAIYRFQGASLENFLFFENRFSGTKVISLKDNYRSNQPILNAAFSLIKSENAELAKLRIPLKATSNAASGTLAFHGFSHQAIEDDWLVNEVKATLQKGVPASEIAIIVRYNKDVVDLTKLLRQSGIAVTPSADSDILSHPITLALENLIRSVVRLDDERALFETLIGGWWGIKAGDLARVLAARSGSWPLYRLIADEQKLEDLKVKDTAKFLHISNLLQSAREWTLTEAPHQILHQLVNISGLLDYLIREDPIDGGRIVRRIYDEVESMTISNRRATLVEIIKQIEYRRLHNLPIEAPFIGESGEAVKVMTVHKSKGLEFHTVFMPRASDKAFGGGGKKDLFKLPLIQHDNIPGLDQEDDERRLLFVAMTRAKVDLLLSHSNTVSDGKLLEPSRFLAEVDEEILPRTTLSDTEVDFQPEHRLKKPLPKFLLSPDLIKDMFLSRGFSVTHLNNYLEDPGKYYYENLLRKPHPKTLSLLRGEAVHDVLEKTVKYLIKSKKPPSNTTLSTWLKAALGRLPLSLSDEAALHEKSLVAIVNYMPRLESAVTDYSKTEVSLNANLNTDDPSLPQIPLTGKIDRMDFDNVGNLVRVTDYKTGKAKSRNDVAGTTKNSNGNNKRQLVFYALLLQLQGSPAAQNLEFTISFVEPKSQNREIVEHTFLIMQEEIDALKNEIIRVAKEITTGEFLSRIS